MHLVSIIIVLTCCLTVTITDYANTILVATASGLNQQDNLKSLTGTAPSCGLPEQRFISFATNSQHPHSLFVCSSNMSGVCDTPLSTNRFHKINPTTLPISVTIINDDKTPLYHVSIVSDKETPLYHVSKANWTCGQNVSLTFHIDNSSVKLDDELKNTELTFVGGFVNSSYVYISARHTYATGVNSSVVIRSSGKNQAIEGTIGCGEFNDLIAQTVAIGVDGSRVLLASFKSQNKAGSALCEYRLSDLERQFENYSNSHQSSFPESGMNSPANNQTKNNTNDKGPGPSSPLQFQLKVQDPLVTNENGMVSLLAMPTNESSPLILYAGTAEGKVIRFEFSSETHLTDTYNASSHRIIQLGLYHNANLLVMTEREIKAVSVKNCDDTSNCSQCLSLDYSAFCGFCYDTGRCSLRSKCKNKVFVKTECIKVELADGLLKIPASQPINVTVNITGISVEFNSTSYSLACVFNSVSNKTMPARRAGFGSSQFECTTPNLQSLPGGREEMNVTVEIVLVPVGQGGVPISLGSTSKSLTFDNGCILFVMMECHQCRTDGYFSSPVDTPTTDMPTTLFQTTSTTAAPTTAAPTTVQATTATTAVITRISPTTNVSNHTGVVRRRRSAANTTAGPSDAAVNSSVVPSSSHSVVPTTTAAGTTVPPTTVQHTTTVAPTTATMAVKCERCMKNCNSCQNGSSCERCNKGYQSQDCVTIAPPTSASLPPSTNATNTTTTTTPNSPPTSDAFLSTMTIIIIGASGGGGILLLGVISCVCCWIRKHRSGIYDGAKGGDMVMSNQGTMRSTSFAMEQNPLTGARKSKSSEVNTKARTTAFNGNAAPNEQELYLEPAKETKERSRVSLSPQRQQPEQELYIIPQDQPSGHTDHTGPGALYLSIKDRSELPSEDLYLAMAARPPSPSRAPHSDDVYLTVNESETKLSVTQQPLPHLANDPYVTFTDKWESSELEMENMYMVAHEGDVSVEPPRMKSQSLLPMKSSAAEFQQHAQQVMKPKAHTVHPQMLNELKKELDNANLVEDQMYENLPGRSMTDLQSLQQLRPGDQLGHSEHERPSSGYEFGDPEIYENVTSPSPQYPQEGQQPALEMDEIYGNQDVVDTLRQANSMDNMYGNSDLIEEQVYANA